MSIASGRLPILSSGSWSRNLGRLLRLRRSPRRSLPRRGQSNKSSGSPSAGRDLERVFQIVIAVSVTISLIVILLAAAPHGPVRDELAGDAPGDGWRRMLDHARSCRD